MGELLTIRQVCQLTSRHPNTVRNLIKSGMLKAKKEGPGPGLEVTLIDIDDLYTCEAPVIRDALDPKAVRQYKTAAERAQEAEQRLKELNEVLSEKERQIEELIEERASMRATIEKGKEAFVSEEVTDAKDWGKAALGVMHSAMQKIPSTREIERLLKERGVSLSHKLVENPAGEIYWEIQYKLTGNKDVWKSAEPLRIPKSIPERTVYELAEDGARNVDVVLVGKEWELRRELPKKKVWATRVVGVSAGLWPSRGTSGLNRYLLRRASGSRQTSAERLRARQLLYVRRLWWILAIASLLVIAPWLIAGVLPISIGMGVVMAGVVAVMVVNCTYKARMKMIRKGN